MRNAYIVLLKEVDAEVQCYFGKTLHRSEFYSRVDLSFIAAAVLEILASLFDNLTSKRLNSFRTSAYNAHLPALVPKRFKRLKL